MRRIERIVIAIAIVLAMSLGVSSCCVHDDCFAYHDMHGHGYVEVPGGHYHHPGPGGPPHHVSHGHHVAPAPAPAPAPSPAPAHSSSHRR